MGQEQESAKLKAVANMEGILAVLEKAGATGAAAEEGLEEID